MVDLFMLVSEPLSIPFSAAVPVGSMAEPKAVEEPTVAASNTVSLVTTSPISTTPHFVGMTGFVTLLLIDGLEVDKVLSMDFIFTKSELGTSLP
jgi:hypothetical protein